MALKGLQAAAIREGPQPDSGVPAASQHGLVDGRERRAPDTSAMALQRQRLHQVRQPPDLQSTGPLGACCATGKQLSTVQNGLLSILHGVACRGLLKLRHCSASTSALQDTAIFYLMCALQMCPACITVPALVGSHIEHS